MYQHTQRQVQLKSKLKLTYIQTGKMQDYRILTDIISKALGGEDAKSTPSETVTTADQIRGLLSM